MRLVFAALTGLALSSCASTNSENGPPADWRSNMRIYRANETPRAARILGQLTATSCKSNPWEREPTDEDATRKLQVDARGMGGDAVGNVTCVIGSALTTKCLSSIVCRGTAIRLDDK
ncbi:Rcs stress response system protein RcsF [Rhodoplanes sp. Z2-YC6860]|uniref:Rcs stress response system protein RcsF n=1 Tax=Rhodoplanes sp. Z2-YC6860 TaxID=674703 RepID=UPI003FA74FBF